MYIHNAASWVLYIVPALDMCVLVPEGLMEGLKLAMLTGYSVIDHMLPNALALYIPAVVHNWHNLHNLRIHPLTLDNSVRDP